MGSGVTKSRRKSGVKLNQLPSEIFLTHIFPLLRIFELLHVLKLVNKRWNLLVWKSLDFRVLDEKKHECSVGQMLSYDLSEKTLRRILMETEFLSSHQAKLILFLHCCAAGHENLAFEMLEKKIVEPTNQSLFLSVSNQQLGCTQIHLNREYLSQKIYNLDHMLRTASVLNHTDMILLFYPLGDAQTRRKFCLKEAIAHGNVQIVQTILNDKEIQTPKDRYMFDALYELTNDHSNIFSLLVAHGRFKLDRTRSMLLLERWIEYGLPKLVKMLLRMTLNLIPDIYGKSCNVLYYACVYGHCSIVQEILNDDRIFSCSDLWRTVIRSMMCPGNTPSTKACKAGCVKLFKWASTSRRGGEDLKILYRDMRNRVRRLPKIRPKMNLK